TLIIDERKGRRIAADLGIKIVGLLGVIVKAKKEGKIEAGLPIIKQLEENGFRISSKIKSIIQASLRE
ncbi:MAG: DUF3368 domain-containing protein, partial [Bacteroidota bacterium]